MLNIFANDAFGVVPLTDAINNVKFVPGRISQLGLFEADGVASTSIGIEQKDGLLVIISPTPRGGPGQTIAKEGRTLRNLIIPHFEINDAVMAEEVQGVRAWGTEGQLETVMGRVNARQALHAQSMAVTQEFSRVGAIKGIVTYANGTTLNLFTEFGVSQIAEIDFDLDNATPASGVLRTKCASVVRLIADELGGIPFTGIASICGDTFFDNLIAHPEVRETYLGWQAAAELRGGYISGVGLSYGAFPFGGIMWENYRGSYGGTAFVHTDKCHIFPTGVPGLFKTRYAPADYNETVNTIGKRLYSKQYPMPNDKGINLDTQMNALEFVTRPRVLLLGKRT